MSASLLGRAGVVQAAAVGLLFVVLLALPLPRALFRDYGAVVGPLSWLACSLVTARILRLSATRMLAAAVLSGLLAGVVGLGLGHLAGMVIGAIAFGGISVYGHARARRDQTLRATCRVVQTRRVRARALPCTRGSRGDGNRTRGLRLERPAS